MAAARQANIHQFVTSLPLVSSRIYYEMSKGLITLSVVSLVFFILSIFLFFSRVFTRVFDTNMLVSKMRVKMQEKCKKNARKFVYIALCIG